MFYKEHDINIAHYIEVTFKWIKLYLRKNS